MGVTEDLIAYLKKAEGVHDVYQMDDDVSQKIWDIEKSVRTTLQNDYKNVGYDIAMKKQIRLCVFYGNTYIFGKRSVVKLMCSDGTIMGTSLHPDEIESYKDRTDVIWISEDFVVFPEVTGVGEESFVLYPIDIPEIEADVPGCFNVIGTSPTLSSDILLKETFGKENGPDIFTMIIALDCE